MKKLTAHERGWVEAFIDAECSLSLLARVKKDTRRGHDWVPFLQCTTTTREQVERLRLLVGGTISGPYPNLGFKNAKVIYHYGMTSNGLRWLLPQLRLITKERHRLLLIEALALLATYRPGTPVMYDKRLQKIRNEMRILNGGV